MKICRREDKTIIILLSGQQSSGKSTLVQKLVKIEPTFKTLNRKQFLYNVREKAIEKFLRNKFQYAENTFGVKIKSFSDVDRNSGSNPELLEFKKEVDAVADGQEFRQFFLNHLFESYAKYITKHCNGTDIYIIDEASIVSDEDFKIFNHYFSEYTVLRAHLSAPLEVILKNCITRNNKFFLMIQELTSITDIDKYLEKKELQLGNSVCSWRNPNDILGSFKRIYNIGQHIEQQSIYSYTIQDMQLICKEIAEEYSRFYKQMKKHKLSYLISNKDFNFKKELKSMYKFTNKIYITNKLPSDILLNVNNLDVELVRRYLLKEIKTKNFINCKLKEYIH